MRKHYAKIKIKNLKIKPCLIHAITVIPWLFAFQAYGTNIEGLFFFNPSAGTVPFQVDASKTGKVDNLNADLVDDLHAADLMAAGGGYTPVYGGWTLLGEVAVEDDDFFPGPNTVSIGILPAGAREVVSFLRQAGSGFPEPITGFGLDYTSAVFGGKDTEGSEPKPYSRYGSGSYFLLDTTHFGGDVNYYITLLKISQAGPSTCEILARGNRVITLQATWYTGGAYPSTFCRGKVWYR